MLVHVSEMPWRRVRNAEATCQKCRGDGVGGGGEAGGGDGVSGRGGEMVVVTASVALMAKRRLLQQMPLIKWVVVGRSFVQCRMRL